MHWRIKCVALTAALTGCASIPESRPAAAPAVTDFEALQIVRIETVGPHGPVGARCGVKNDRGGSEIVAPGVAEVIRSARPLEIVCFAAGHRVALLSLDSTGDVIGPAATGAVTGGAVSAVAALPLLTVPVFGPFMYAGVVGGAAIIGSAVNAADKHTKGKIYSYPPSAVVNLAPLDALPGSASFQVTARAPVALEPVPQAASGTLQAPRPVVAAMPLATPLAAPAPPAAEGPFRVAAVAPRSSSAQLLPTRHDIPEFPEEAVRAGVSEGRVRAQLEIAADGHVTGVKILEARPERVFDAAVTSTLSRWTFPSGEGRRQFDAEIDFRR